jgi:hypothetical protein
MVRPTIVAILVPVLVAVSGCGSTASPSPTPTQQPTPSIRATPDASVSVSPRASDATQPPPSGATLASGDALPACVPGSPEASATISFVAEGHAWALDPINGDLTCLFATDDPGPFTWGPLGDRVLLGGLEVSGVAGGPSLAASGQSYDAITWSRPTGKSIVLAPAAAGAGLEKIHLDGTRTEDVTPLPKSTYLSVAYHPSGEAFAFAVERAGSQSIWMSSNTGKDPGRLVFSDEGTTFGAIGFETAGTYLLYAAQHADGHAELHRIDVTAPTTAPVLWAGPIGKSILDLKPGFETGTLAWTMGTTSCADSIAMALSPSGVMHALPSVTGPTHAVGWLDMTRLLVSSGGCGEPVDLYAVDVIHGSVRPLVAGVAAAAVRTPVPTPPAPMPKTAATNGSGFG